MGFWNNWNRKKIDADDLFEQGERHYNNEEYEKAKDVNWHTFYVDKNFDYNKFIDALKGKL